MVSLPPSESHSQVMRPVIRRRHIVYRTIPNASQQINQQELSKRYKRILLKNRIRETVSWGWGKIC